MTEESDERKRKISAYLEQFNDPDDVPEIVRLLIEDMDEFVSASEHQHELVKLMLESDRAVEVARLAEKYGVPYFIDFGFVTYDEDATDFMEITDPEKAARFWAEFNAIFKREDK